MQTVVETSLFIKQVTTLFTESERNDLIDSSQPVLMSAMKFREPAAFKAAVRGKGERGGARVIYFWYSDGAPIYALLATERMRRST